MTDQRKYHSLEDFVQGLSEEFGDSHHYWILAEHVAVPATAFEWAAWLGTAGPGRVVKQEQIGPYFVSTVFLGLNHNFLMSGPPILFETMVFTDEDWKRQGERRTEGEFKGLPRGLPEIDMERCSTWEQAVEQHERIVAFIKTVEV